LVASVREHGPGRNYLVRHPAGSGKSNCIAWLAHRRSSLHDVDDDAQRHSGGQIALEDTELRAFGAFGGHFALYTQGSHLQSQGPSLK